MATPGKSGISSRLLTMKFMQRGAAASSPENESQSPDQRPSKRQKRFDSKPSSSAESDRKSVQAAIAEEERKRLQALERQGAEAGETKWTLDIAGQESNTASPDLKVISAGYSTIDAQSNKKSTDDEEEEVRKSTTGRKSFGNFRSNSEPEKPSRQSGDANGDDDFSSNSSEQSSEADASEDDTREGRGFGRPDLHSIKKQKGYPDEKQDAAQLASRRRNEENKASIMTSISSGGGAKSIKSRSDVQCYKCGKVGHVKSQCPLNQPMGLSGKGR